MGQPDSLVDQALGFLQTQLGKEYQWGGDDPVGGFDCSGIQQEALRTAGRLPAGGPKLNAQAMYDRAKAAGQLVQPGVLLQRGMLVFYTRARADGTAYVGHVVMVYATFGAQIFTIGAEGGGSTTLTREQAIAQNAFVKIRPIVPGWAAAWNPF